MSLCMVGDCTRPGVRFLPDGITRACWGHLRRAKLHQPLTSLRAPQGTPLRLKRKPSQRLAAAAIRYAESDPIDDDDFRRAWNNLLDAAHELVLRKRRGARAARAS